MCYGTDWTDPISLRERLAEIHAEDFVPPYVARIERRMVATLVAMTGLSSEAVRANARADADFIMMDA